jgi:hypothetical protein
VPLAEYRERPNALGDVGPDEADCSGCR